MLITYYGTGPGPFASDEGRQTCTEEYNGFPKEGCATWSHASAGAVMSGVSDVAKSGSGRSKLENIHVARQPLMYVSPSFYCYHPAVAAEHAKPNDWPAARARWTR